MSTKTNPSMSEMRRDLIRLQRRDVEAYLGQATGGVHGLSAPAATKLRRRYDEMRTRGVAHDTALRVVKDQVHAMSSQSARPMSTIERDARRGVNPLASAAESMGMKRKRGAPPSTVHRLAAKEFHDGPSSYGDDLPPELEDYGASNQGTVDEVWQRVRDAWRAAGKGDADLIQAMQALMNPGSNEPPMEGRGPARV